MTSSKDTDYTFSFINETTNSNTNANSNDTSIVQKNYVQMTKLFKDLLKEYSRDVANAAYTAAFKGAKKDTNISNADSNTIRDKALELLSKKIDLLLHEDSSIVKQPTKVIKKDTQSFIDVATLKKLFDEYKGKTSASIDQTKLENILTNVVKSLLSKADKNSKAKIIEENINKVLKSSQDATNAVVKVKKLVASDNKFSITNDGNHMFGLFQEMAVALKDMHEASKELKTVIATLPKSSRSALLKLTDNTSSLISNAHNKISNLEKNDAFNPTLLLKNSLKEIVSDIRKVSPKLADKTIIKTVERFNGTPKDFAQLVENLGNIKDSINTLDNESIKQLRGISKILEKFSNNISNVPDIPTDMVPSRQWKEFATDTNLVKNATKELVLKLNINSKELDDYLSKRHSTTVDIKLGKNELENVVVDIDKVVKSLIVKLTKLSNINVPKEPGKSDISIEQKNKATDLLKKLTASKDSVAGIKGFISNELKGTNPKDFEFYRKTPEIRKPMTELKYLTQPYDIDALEKARKELVDKAHVVTNDVVDIVKDVGNTLSDNITSVMGDKYKEIKNLNKFGLKKQDKVRLYPEVLLPQTRSVDITFQDKLKDAEKSEASVKENINTLVNSLVDLQKYIIKSLDDGFKKNGSGWAVVRRSATEPINKYFTVTKGFNKKTSGKQFSLKIADVKGLKRATSSMSDNPVDLINRFKSQVIDELISKNQNNLADQVGLWIKRFSKEEIANWGGLDSTVAKELSNLKANESTKGNFPSKTLIEALKSRSDLKNIYAATVGEVTANNRLTTPQGNNTAPYVRDIAIPAAKLTSTGASIFETQQGSQRVIPKFAVYKTGFENLYEKLTKTNNFDVKKDYHNKINKLGIRPVGSDFEKANELASNMIMDYGSSSQEARKDLVKQYKTASVIRGQKLYEQKHIDDPTVFSNAVIKVLKSEFSSGDFDTQDLIKRMSKMDVAPYDVTKSMESVKFKDIYVMFKELLSKSGAIENLAKNPKYDSTIREQETMLRKLVGKIPIADPNRPRRYAHQEKIVNLMSMTNPAINKYGSARFSPEDTKKYIRDLNLNLQEFIKETKVLNKAGINDRKLPLDVKALSSLGVPESQAASLDEFRLQSSNTDDRYLAPFKATNLKMYSDVLPEFAPFSQFQQRGRNISNITNAMAYRPSGFRIGTDFPGLRSEKGNAAIAGGRYGDQGYGFNVIAELRNTASTFEDQIVISGKLADVLTSITKNLIKPDELGKLDLITNAGEIRNPTDLAVSALKPKVLTDTKNGIEAANRVIQEVLGIKDEYKGRADKALLRDIHKAITVVRGKELNVQVAKLVETFMNYYGRKFSTEYGSKGVAITAEGGHELTGKQVAERFKDKRVSVLSEDERKKAGLGSVILPRSMGSLLAEIVNKNVGDLGIKDDVAKSLSKKLRASGNKFMIDLFTNANLGVVPETEAKIQSKLFKDISFVMEKLGLHLRQGIEGIKEVKDFYMKSKNVSGKLFEEKPIDIRISSFGAAKRGLQTEDLEIMMNNVINAGAAGKTVLKDKFSKNTYKKLLGNKDGSLDAYSKALGFSSQVPSKAGLKADMIELLKSKGIDESTPEFKKQLDELIDLETKHFYSDIIDEFGKKRKSLVGNKFVEVLEDPHTNPAWISADIKKKRKGERLNLPAFGAYAAIFGEHSDFIKQLSEDIPSMSKKHWEFIKSLQTINSHNPEMREQLLSSARKVDVKDINSFYGSTGTFSNKGALNSLLNTIVDTKAYPEPLNLQIPSIENPRKRSSFYVPSAIGRTTYPEPAMAGEYGMDIISRRLQNIINYAKEVDLELNKIQESGSGLTYDTIGRIKSNLAKYRATVGDIVGTNPENKQLSSKEEDVLKNILSNMMPVLERSKVNPKLTYGAMQGPSGPFNSRADYINSFLNKQLSTHSKAKAYQTTISQAIDQIIGPFGSKENEPNPLFKQRYDKDASIIGPIENNQKALEELSKHLHIEPPKEKDRLNKALKKLEQAKIEYYDAITKAVLGKTGSVQELLFSRKIPAVIAKAVQATVDKTDDLAKFSKALTNISKQTKDLGVPEVNTLQSIVDDTNALYESHSKNIAKYKSKGFPVLKENQLGVPETQAEKLPAEFIKKYKVKKSGELIPILDSKYYGKGTNLKELLKYRNALEKGKTQFPVGSSDRLSIEHDLKYRLTPYIESVRFPFTGVSSVQPYEAKLLSPKKGQRQLSKHTLIAPGVPDLDFKAFDAIKTKSEAVLDSLITALEQEQSKPVPDKNRVEKLIKTINALDKAISGVIPKYIAQQQKLDFDGDQIEIHSAKTSAARKEIEKHFKFITDYSKFKGTTAQTFRNKFTYDAMVPSSGKYILAEQQLAFQKKFPSEEGFNFLKYPFLTKKLEYLSNEDRLNVLAKVPGEGGTPMGPYNAISSVLPEVYRDKDIRSKILDTLQQVKLPTKEGVVDSPAYTKELLAALKSLGPSIDKVVNEGIKSSLFNTKHLTTINAQLYKANTGVDTEALNRILKLFERNIGFGGGLIRGKGEYKFSPAVAKRMPNDLNVLGKKMGEELTTMMNEVIRVGIQKGMDVKHAGETPIATEMANLLASGPIGVNKLISKIRNKEGSYKDLQEFSEANKETLKRNFASMSTEQLRADAVKLAKGRGQNVQQFATKDREGLKKYIAQNIGFEGFLRELSTEIVEAAYEGIKDNLSKVKDQSKALKPSDIEDSLAKGLPIDIRNTFENNLLPLYKYRTSGVSGYTQRKLYETKYQDIQTPELGGLFSNSNKYDKNLIDKYKNAKATSVNLQEALAGSVMSNENVRGSYTMMRSGTVKNLKLQQIKINELNKLIENEGDRTKFSVEDRLAGRSPMSSFTKEILAIKNNKERVAKLSEISEQVGVPELGQRQKQELLFKFIEEAGAYAENNVQKSLKPRETYTSKESYDKDYFRKLEELKQDYLNKAYAVYQSDLIMKTAKAKKGEVRFLSTLIPNKPLTSEHYKKARQYVKKANEINADAKKRSSYISYDYSKQSMHDVGGGGTGATNNIFTNGGNNRGAIDVRLVDITSEVRSFLSGHSVVSNNVVYTNPQRSISDELKKEIEEAERISAAISGGLNEANDSNFGLKYRASGLKGVGDNSPESIKKQIQNIADIMQGTTKITDKMASSALLGNAIHAKLENIYKSKTKYYTSSKSGEPLKKEKYITQVEVPISPKFVDEVGGEISGTMDVVRKKQNGIIDEIIDIKTLSKENFNALKDALRALGKKTASISEVKRVVGSPYLKHNKLDEVASQLNLYLKATNPKAKAEAHFYSNTDTDFNNPIKLTTQFNQERFNRDMRAIAVARKMVKLTGGTFAPTASYEKSQEIASNASKNKVPDEDVNKLLDIATRYYKAVTSTTDKRRYIDLQSTDKTYGKNDFSNINKERRGQTGKFKTLDDMLRAHPIPEGAESHIIAEHLKNMQRAAKAFQRDVYKIELIGPEFEKLPEEIKTFIKDTVQKGPRGMDFSEIVTAANRSTDKNNRLEDKDIIKAWKAYRIALGDYYVNMIEQAEKEIDNTAPNSNAQYNAFDKYQSMVNKFQKRIKSDLGKSTDIYTTDHRYISPESAKGAGVFLEKPELIKKAAQPLGEDDKLKLAFNKLTDIHNDVLPIPREAVRDALSSITNLKKSIVSLYTDGDKISAMGDKIKDAFDFTTLRRSISRLKEAVATELSFNTKDIYTPEQIAYLQEVLKQLKAIEKTYINLDLEEQSFKNSSKAYKFPTLIDVPRSFNRDEQNAVNMLNEHNLRNYFRKPESEGGAKKGDVIPYNRKIYGPNGRIITNQRVIFQKLGDTYDSSGKKIGIFNERFKDLNKVVGEGNRTFKVAIDRVIKWGAAASLVYGGVSYLKDTIEQISAVETEMARLKMVMNPLSTNFDTLRNSAIGFAKQYGVETTGVLQGMKVYAQQGLSQSDVVERTKTSTLASNVTTLNAVDATEALTAAMKVFHNEGEDSMRFLDSWSEVEAKAAITAGDLADAIKKAASAGKNAGFTFDELNGMIAALGSVTRQTGKEVGTSLRFIFRRLTSQKGPKELAKLNIPVVNNSGQLRSGFNVLSDLAEKWKEISSAQKLAIAQAIGGTRQYNAVLVLMDNWDKVTRSLTHSINSKGSAERRNLELMKTYAKQLAQTKASASELKIELGKLVLPTFKTGLKAIKTLLEVINSIPTPIKAAIAGMTTFFAFAAKGAPIIDGIVSSITKGKLILSGLGDALSSGMQKGAYEALGIGNKSNSSTLEGLNKIGEPNATGINKFNSALGKTGYLLTEIAKKYNTFLGKSVKTPSDMVAKISGTVKDTLQSIDDSIDYGQKILFANSLSGGPASWVSDIVAQIIEAGVKSTKWIAAASEKGSKLLGSGASKFMKGFASDNTGLLKAVTPLAITGLGVGTMVGPALKHVKAYLETADQYRDSKYKSIAVNEKEVQSIRDVQASYDKYSKKLKSISSFDKSPIAKNRALKLDTYKSPLLDMIRLQKQFKGFNNNLIGVSPNTIAGYDKFGNAIVGVTTNLRSYLDILERTKGNELAQQRVDIASKYIKDVTATGGSEKVKEELKSLAEEFPLIGKMLSSNISVGTRQAISTIRKELNKLISAKSKNPITTAFDNDIKKLETKLGILRNNFKSSVKEINKALNSIDLKGLSSNDIVNIFNSPKLKKGYQLLLDYETKFNTPFTKGKASVGDLIGKNVLSGVNPDIRGILEALPELTIENAKEQRMKPITAETLKYKSTSNSKNKYKEAIARTGDLIIFNNEFAKKYNMAGRQALLTVKDTDKLVLEYFDKRQSKLEHLDIATKDVSPFVQAIIPVKKIMSETEDQLSQLNAFVIGAEAGITAMSPKTLRERNLNLGGRFYSDVSTSSLVQSQKGYNPVTGSFGIQTYKEKYANEFKKYLSEPMTEYSSKLEQLRALTYEGINSSDINLVGSLRKELSGIQDVIKNNQVVFQYRAAHEDLNKTLEAGTRALKQNMAVEKERLKRDTYKTGYLKGVPKGLENIEFGSYSKSNLSAQQRLLKESTSFRTSAINAKSLGLQISALNEQLSSIIKTKVAIKTIDKLNSGFGNIIKGKDRESFIKLTKVGASPLEAKMVLQNDAMIKEDRNINSNLEEIIGLIDPEKAALKLGKRIADDINNNSKNMFPTTIFKGLGKLSKLRDKAFNAGDKETAGKMDQLLNSLSAQTVSTLGADKVLRALSFNKFANIINPFMKTMSKTEFIGRAIGGANIAPKQFINTLDRTRKIAGSSESIKDTSAFKKWKSISESSSKEPIISAKNIIKASTAVAIASQFAKLAEGSKATSLAKQIDELELQKKQQKAAGIPVDDIVKKIMATKMAYDKSSKMSAIYGVTQASSGIIGGSALFAKTIGLSEGKTKGVAATAIGTYALLKVLSSSVGQKLPKYVKDFGEHVKKFVKKFSKGEKPGIRDKYSFKKSAEEFMKIYKSEAESATGTSSSDVSKNAKKIFDENTTKSMRELDKLSKEEYKKAAATVDKHTLSLLHALTIELATAFSGYVAKQPDTRFNTLNANAKKERAAFNEILKNNTQYLDKAFKDIFSKENKNVESSSTKVFSTKRESKLLNVDKAKEIQLASLTSTYKGLENKRNELVARQQDELLKLDIAKILKESSMALEKYATSVKENNVVRTVNNRLAGPLTVSGNLKGYSMSTTLPLFDENMSAQQRLYGEKEQLSNREELENMRAKYRPNIFKNLYDSFKLSIAKRYFDTSYLKTISDSSISKSLLFSDTKLHKTTREYFDDYNAMGKVRSDLIGSAHAVATEISKLTTKINTADQEPKVVTAAKDRREHLRQVYESIVSNTDRLTKHMERLGASLKYMVTYADAVYKLNDALKDINVQNVISGLSSMKVYLDDISKMVGGSSPEAAQEITIAQERMGRRVGVPLENRVSNKYDIERAQILDSIFKGQAGSEAFYRLSTIDAQKSRDISNTKERINDETFRNSLKPFKTFLYSLEKIRNMKNIDANYGFLDKLNPWSSSPSEEIGNTIKHVSELLENAFKKTTVSEAIHQLLIDYGNKDITRGELNAELAKYKGLSPDTEVYRGIPLKERKDLTSMSGKYNKMVKEAFKAAPTFDMQKMSVAVTDPITRRLDDTNKLLSEITQKGISLKDKNDDKDKFKKPSFKEYSASSPLLKLLSFNALGKADGGRVFGNGGPRDDKVKTYLSPGEFVIRQKAATKIGYANLEKMNQGGTLPFFADGGVFDSMKSGKGFRTMDSTLNDIIGSLESKRLGSVRSDGVTPTSLAKQGIFASGELVTRLAKFPIDLFSMMEGTSDFIGTHGVSGAVNFVDLIKDLVKQKIKQKGVIGVLSSVSSSLKDSFMNSISKGGLGITAGILGTISGVNASSKVNRVLDPLSNLTDVASYSKVVIKKSAGMLGASFPKTLMERKGLGSILKGTIANERGSIPNVALIAKEMMQNKFNAIDTMFNKAGFPKTLDADKVAEIKAGLMKAKEFAADNDLLYNGPWYLSNPEKPAGYMHTFTANATNSNAGLTFTVKPEQDFLKVMKRRIAENAAAVIKTKAAPSFADGGSLSFWDKLNGKQFENATKRLFLNRSKLKVKGKHIVLSPIKSEKEYSLFEKIWKRVVGKPVDWKEQGELFLRGGHTKQKSWEQYVKEKNKYADGGEVLSFVGRGNNLYNIDKYGNKVRLFNTLNNINNIKDNYTTTYMKNIDKTHRKWGFTSYKHVADIIAGNELDKAKAQKENAKRLATKSANSRRILQSERVITRGFMSKHLRKYVTPSSDSGEDVYSKVGRDGAHNIIVGNRVLGGVQALKYYGNEKFMRGIKVPNLGNDEQRVKALSLSQEERTKKSKFFANFNPSTDSIPTDMLSDYDTRYLSALKDITSLIALRSNEIKKVKSKKERRKKELELEKLKRDQALAEKAVDMVATGRNPATAIYDVYTSLTVGQKKERLRKDKEAGLIDGKDYKRQIKLLKQYSSDDARLRNTPKQKVSLGSIVAGAGSQAKANLFSADSAAFSKLFGFDRTTAFSINPGLYQQLIDAKTSEERENIAKKLVLQINKPKLYKTSIGYDDDARSEVLKIIKEYLKQYTLEKKVQHYFGEGKLQRKSFRGIAKVISGHAFGGRIIGKGGPSDDKIPAMVSPGEFIIREKAAKRIGYSKLIYMNQNGDIPHFSGGGKVLPKIVSGTSSIKRNELATASLNSTTVIAKLDPEARVKLQDNAKVEAVLKDNKVELADKEVVLKDNKVELADKEVVLKDNKVELSNKEVTAKLDKDTVKLDNNEVVLKDNKVTLDNKEVVAKLNKDTVKLDNNEVVLKDNKVELSNKEVTAKLDKDTVTLDNKTIDLATKEVKVSLDKTSIPISKESIDTLVNNITTAIHDVLSNINTHNGSAVGADKLDEFAIALAKVNDRIPGIVKTEVETQVLDFTKTHTVGTVNIQKQVDNLTTLINNASDKLSNIDIKYSQQLEQVQSKANMALNFRNI